MGGKGPQNTKVFKKVLYKRSLYTSLAKYPVVPANRAQNTPKRINKKNHAKYEKKY